MVGLRRRDMMRLYSSAPEPVPTWYITDGLVMHLDGIDNTGSGHSDSASTWKDLTNNGHDISFTGTVGSNYMKPSKRCSSATGLSRTEYSHVELVLKGVTRSGSAILHPQGNNVGSIWIGSGGGIYTAGGSTRYYGKTITMDSEEDSPISAISMEVARNPSIIYLNGEPVTSDVNSTGTWGSNNNSKYWFGYAATSYVFNMPIYSIRFYNKVLTASEILNNWQVDKARFGL